MLTIHLYTMEPSFKEKVFYYQFNDQLVCELVAEDMNRMGLLEVNGKTYYIKDVECIKTIES